MSSSYKIRNQDAIYFATFTVVRWLDVFTRREYKDIIVDSLNYSIQKKGLELHAWVIMSNHVHLILGTNGTLIEDMMRDIKRHTSKMITKAISENPQESRRDLLMWCFEREGKLNPNNEYVQFWQQGSHPIELWSNAVMDQKLDYLHDNPVKAGWVDEPEHYLYSSARDYAGGKGLVDGLILIR